jgi:O-acetyl-ADP-ribose deacetylase (regulator of RNase III)
MDAGMDLAVVRFFGHHVMERIQQHILEDFLGEQPVGTCIIVPTDHALHPFVAHAPTMRIPMNIDGTDHAYVAMWAVLLAVHRHNRCESRAIESLACPGLGTGTGGMNPIEAALQMRLAYEHFRHPPHSLNPSAAQQRHERVHYDGRWGFTQPRNQIGSTDTP